MNSKNLILFILLCLGITSAFGIPVDSLGLKKDNNKTYIVYKVENKQPLYSILKHFNLSLTEFKQINPESFFREKICAITADRACTDD